MQSFRLYDPHIAEAVTTTGQSVIKFTTNLNANVCNDFINNYDTIIRLAYTSHKTEFRIRKYLKTITDLDNLVIDKEFIDRVIGWSKTYMTKRDRPGLNLHSYEYDRFTFEDYEYNTELTNNDRWIRLTSSELIEWNDNIYNYDFYVDKCKQIAKQLITERSFESQTETLTEI